MKIRFAVFLAVLLTMGISCKNESYYTMDAIEQEPRRHTNDYFYLPEQGVYYDIPTKEWVYHDGNSWTRSYHLPDEFSVVNVNTAKKVRLDYHGERPYVLYLTHKIRYPRKATAKEVQSYKTSRKAKKKEVAPYVSCSYRLNP
jgi:hypothetical protein